MSPHDRTHEGRWATLAGLVPICSRSTLVNLTPKYPTLVSTTPDPGARVSEIKVWYTVWPAGPLLWSRVKKSKYTSAFRFSRPDATRHDTGPLLTIIPKPQPQHDPSQGGPTDRVDNELLLHSSSDRAAFTASSNGGMNLPGLLTWPSFAMKPPRNASRPVREDAR